ncbi:MAG TPA: recombinase family protein [Kofleriaceae bacterium]|nr:recombinase family protein [Kofleriaceae bacterium]
MSEKITARHLGRKAILYVRQSTQQQVVHNDESRRLQYAMRERLLSLGWRDVEVVDDDLGRSAAGHVERPGFEHLMASVSMGDVGAVAARELSRFARNSREWQKLLEVCRYVDTLLVDQDAVYDVRSSNDRLLLGLKGNLNEYELELLRLRAHEARREKARRGEFTCMVAVGFRKTDDGRVEKTPDLRVQQAIGLVFEKFLELGSVRQAMLWFREQGLQLPRNRSHRGLVVWRPPEHGHLYSLLSNPVYAGAYAYGRTEVRTKLVQGEPRKKLQRMPREQWKVLLRDHHEGYITWETFERIQKTMSDNNVRSRGKGSSPGAPRKGQALLAGLVRCRRCGTKMLAGYSGGSVPRYECVAGPNYGDPRCIGFSGVDVDARIASLLLEVVRPAAVEASYAAVAHQSAVRDQTRDAMRMELQSARYEADRAFRQFDAADPGNRLVVDELERRWNVALERVREIENRLAAHTSQDPTPTVPERVFQTLAEDLEKLWHAPTTDMVLKKRLARALIEEVVADLDASSREITLMIHWKGGVHTELRVCKRARGSGCRTPADVVEAIRVLALVCDDAHIAQFLSKAGLRTAKGNAWSRELVATARHKRGIPAHSASQREAEGWMTLDQAAAMARVAHPTIRRAAERGEVPARQPLPLGPWVLRREDVLAWKERRAAASDHGSEQLPLAISTTYRNGAV